MKVSHLKIGDKVLVYYPASKHAYIGYIRDYMGYLIDGGYSFLGKEDIYLEFKINELSTMTYALSLLEADRADIQFEILPYDSPEAVWLRL